MLIKMTKRATQDEVAAVENKLHAGAIKPAKWLARRLP